MPGVFNQLQDSKPLQEVFNPCTSIKQKTTPNQLLKRKNGDITGEKGRRQRAGRDEGFCQQLPESKVFKHPKKSKRKNGLHQSKVAPTPRRTRERGKRRRLCSEETKHQSEETS